MFGGLRNCRIYECYPPELSDRRNSATRLDGSQVSIELQRSGYSANQEHAIRQARVRRSWRHECPVLRNHSLHVLAAVESPALQRIHDCHTSLLKGCGCVLGDSSIRRLLSGDASQIFWFDFCQFSRIVTESAGLLVTYRKSERAYAIFKSLSCVHCVTRNSYEVTSTAHARFILDLKNG